MEPLSEQTYAEIRRLAFADPAAFEGYFSSDLKRAAIELLLKNLEFLGWLESEPTDD